MKLTAVYLKCLTNDNILEIAPRLPRLHPIQLKELALLRASVTVTEEVSPVTVLQVRFLTNVFNR